MLQLAELDAFSQLASRRWPTETLAGYGCAVFGLLHGGSASVIQPWYVLMTRQGFQEPERMLVKFWLRNQTARRRSRLSIVSSAGQ